MKNLYRKIRFFIYVRTLMQSQYWERTKLDALANHRLKTIIRHAARIPFWQEIFLQTGINAQNFTQADLSKLPIISKKNFLGKDVSYYTDAALLPESYCEKTSGSTGEPFGFYHGLEYEWRCCAVRERWYRTLGEGKRFFVIFIRSVERRAFALSGYQTFPIKSVTDIPGKFRELSEVISKHPDGVILHGFTSWLVTLAAVVRDSGVALPIRGVIPAGEELSDVHREQLQDAFGADVHIGTGYGMSEMGSMATDCEYGYKHICEEWVYVEITDEHDKPLPVGAQGHIVVTSFYNRVMPLLRYNTGDLGVISGEPCPCGRTLRTITLQGRQMHLLQLPDGSQVSVVQVSGVLSLFPQVVQKYQIVWNGGYSFVIKIISGSQFNAVSKEKLTQRLREKIHPAAHITWEIVDAIAASPSGKAIYFVDNSKNQPNNT